MIRNCGDCFFTSVACTALLIKGGWLLAKNSAEEGALACQTGSIETVKSVRHLTEEIGLFFECITSIVRVVLKDVGHLFLIFYQQTGNNLHATGHSLYSVAEIAAYSAKPLRETGQLFEISAYETTHAFRHFWNGCRITAQIFHAIVTPYLRETFHKVPAGWHAFARTGHGAATALLAGSEVVQAAVGGSTREMLDLLSLNAKDCSKTVIAAKGSLDNLFSLSQKSIYRVFLEALFMLGTGCSESLKAFRSLPQAIQSLLLLPAEGALSLLQECLLTLANSPKELGKTWQAAGEGAEVCVDFLKAIVYTFLQNLGYTGAQGVKEMRKAFNALIQALEHSTEYARSSLLALLLEIGSSFNEGIDSSLRAGQAAKNGIYQGGELTWIPLDGSLHESLTAFKKGGSETQKSIIAAIQSITTVGTPLQDLTMRIAYEAASSLNVLAIEAGKSMRTFKKVTVLCLGDACKLSLRIIFEAGFTALEGLSLASRCNYQMSHKLRKSLKVHIFYPVEEWFHPRMQAVRAVVRQIEERMNSILSSLASNPSS